VDVLHALGVCLERLADVGQEGAVEQRHRHPDVDDPSTGLRFIETPVGR
jgi:hypothetical protein